MVEEIKTDCQTDKELVQKFEKPLLRLWITFQGVGKTNLEGLKRDSNNTKEKILRIITLI